jgi:hypothetical protein
LKETQILENLGEGWAGGGETTDSDLLIASANAAKAFVPEMDNKITNQSMAACQKHSTKPQKRGNHSEKLSQPLR